nr:peptidoglycan DD-metalloendopeptidase family protein [Ornithinibacillus hominis]
MNKEVESLPFAELGFRITSPYGYRTDPITGQINVFHSGIDLVKAHQAPLEAFVGGTVLYAADGVSGTGVGGYGKVVVIQDKNSCAHIYAHLDSVAVRKGQRVSQGDIIGRQGATGNRVTGSHLHYEVRKKSSPALGWIDDPIARTHDPTKYLEEYYATDNDTKSETVYVVKPGDTLTKIANKFNTSVDALAKLNGISQRNLILIGQRIKLPENSTSRKETLYLPRTISRWRVYPLNKAPIKGNEKGILNPRKFGGLQYEVLGKPQAHVVTIQTRDFGKVNIYVHPSTGAVIA